LIAFAVLLFAGPAGRAAAQSTTPAIEGGAGMAWFADESPIEHTVGSGALRWALSPRVSIGPEVTFMRGPGSDRDLIVTGNITFDTRPSGITPFIVGGGGLFRHSDRFGRETFSSMEGAFTAGGGVRFPLKSGLYIAPEARVGWELHTRLQVTVGYRAP
jgi:hypothetical protein